MMDSRERSSPRPTPLNESAELARELTLCERLDASPKFKVVKDGLGFVIGGFPSAARRPKK